MSRIQWLINLTIIALLAVITTAFADPVEEAVIAALQGPESRRLKIANHEFYVKPITIDTIGEMTVIVGQISHYRGPNWWGYDVTDDQVLYTIIKVDGTIGSIDRKINYGGYSSIFNVVKDTLGWLKVPFVNIGVGDVVDKLKPLDKLITGEWESVADFLIAQVAVRVDLGTESDIDRPGLDYTLPGFPLPNAQPTLCKTACDNDPVCKAWTYVQPGIQGSQARCWLKASVPAPQKNPCCVSGVMRLLD